MASIKEITLGRSDVYRIDPRIIKELSGWNVRLPSPELTSHIRKLADSIKEIGVKEALKIIMKDGEPYVTRGHCRLAATMIAISEGCDIKSVPVTIEDTKTYNKEDRVLEIAVSNEGLPLTMLEQSEVYKRLVAWEWPIETIAKKSGYSANHIKNCLLLGSSCPEIRKLVQEGKVSASLAIRLIQEVGEEEALKQLTGAIQTATESGKKKATKKDTDAATCKAKNKKFNWGKYGPMLFAALESICTCPAKGKGSENMGDYLVQGNEIIDAVIDAGYVKE
jgi:ParB-like chromosome segregation protein Spo0J